MYAVLLTGGKQYRVMQGETLRVEKLDGDVGAALKFENEQVLMLADADNIHLGDALKGSSIAATIKSHGRADKIASSSSAAASTIASRWGIGRATPRSRSPASMPPSIPRKTLARKPALRSNKPWHIKRA